MKVLLPAFLGKYVRPADRPTDRPGHKNKTLRHKDTEKSKILLENI